MKFKKGDRIICVSTKPNQKVVDAFGDYAYFWYNMNLELNKVYTIIDVNSSDSSWEQLRLTEHGWFGEINFKLLKDIRKQKIEKLNEK